MEIKGIDVSAWQGKIDWKTVADYGMGFAILRSQKLAMLIDSQFENNPAGCNKYNIPCRCLQILLCNDDRRDPERSP